MAIITNPITGVSVEALTISDVYGLAEKIAMEYLTGAEIKNQYPELEQSRERWAAIHGTGYLAPAESSAVDKNSMSKAAPHYPEFVTEYFKGETEKRYWIDYREQDAQEVLNGTMSIEAFVAILINSLTDGYVSETNTAMKNALGYQQSDGTETAKAMIVVDASGEVVTGDTSVLGALGQYEELGAVSFEKIYQRLMNRAKLFTKENNDFSNGILRGAENADICIYLPIDFTAAAGFAFLSKWNNQGEANKLPTIYETDGLSFVKGDKQVGVALIVDKRAIAHIETYRDVQPYIEINRGHARGLSLLVKDQIPLARNFKAYAIVFEIPDTEVVNIAGTVNIDGEGAFVNA